MMNKIGIGVILMLAALAAEGVLFGSNCDEDIRSADGLPKIGNFTSPNYPNNYGDGLKCTIKFVAQPHERVTIKFDDFLLDGFPNRLAGYSTGCTDDYIDVYTQIEHPDHEIIELPLQGRYCGNDIDELPHLLMSLNRTIIITFDSNRDHKTARGFRGTYQFVSNEPYEQGISAQYGVCGWTIKAENRPTGQIVAPFYPSQYPDNLDCYYRLDGLPGQRIRLAFTDFDLYYGGDHCPYDYLKVHDGLSSSDPLIDTYCDSLKNLVIYSTGPSLYLQFVTQSGRPKIETQWGDEPLQMRGFNATYTFSDGFVDLGFIRHGSQHLVGTECDVRVRSFGETEGEIVTPNFPGTAPANITCYFYIDGLIDDENLEKVVLNFTSVLLPTAALTRSCTENTAALAAYLNGQNPVHEHADLLLCDQTSLDSSLASRIVPRQLTSENPRLALKFSTKSTPPNQPVGFQAKYKFIVDYAIEGTPIPPENGNDNKCHYIYYSRSTKKGKINSPRYPSSYPNDIECIYELVPMPNEFIMISFDTFDVERVSHSPGQCLGDRLTSESIVKHADNTTSVIPMGTYCGDAYPGPLVTEWLAQKMIVKFTSDSDVAYRGFQANYEFLYSSERFPCGGNITSGGYGEVVPPNYPLKYQTRTVCDWYIYAKNSQAQIKINFEHFDIEGNIEDGCQGAVLRIYKEDKYNVDYEICGQDSTPFDNIMSVNGFIRVKFISSSRSFGKTGFKIAWTEVILTDTEGATRLTHTKILYIIISCVIVLLIVVLITICCCIRKSSKNSQRKSTSSEESRKSSPHDNIDPEDNILDHHDHLSKAPMLPSSQSSNSTFNPYDPLRINTINTSQYNADPHASLYDPMTVHSMKGKYEVPAQYDTPPLFRNTQYEHSAPLRPYEQVSSTLRPYEISESTLSSRSTHSSSNPHYTNHQRNSHLDYKGIPRSSPYMDSCLTSL